MSTVKSKKLQVGTDASASNNFTIYQPATPDGTLRIGVGNADSPTEVGRFDSNGYVATNAPCFAAYQSSAQTISTNTFTKVSYQAEEFDLTSDFDTSTYKFTPSVKGYYQFNARAVVNSTNDIVTIALYKNGVVDKRGTSTRDADSQSARAPILSQLVYANGTTDYFEIYVYHNSGTSETTAANANQINFQAFLARAV